MPVSPGCVACKHAHSHIPINMYLRVRNWKQSAAQVKNLPIMQEMWVQFLGWEDLLQKEMATHSSTLAWKI